MSILDDLIADIDNPKVKEKEPEKEIQDTMFPYSEQFKEYAENKTAVGGKDSE